MLFGPGSGALVTETFIRNRILFHQNANIIEQTLLKAHRILGKDNSAALPSGNWLALFQSALANVGIDDVDTSTFNSATHEHFAMSIIFYLLATTAEHDMFRTDLILRVVSFISSAVMVGAGLGIYRCCFHTKKADAKYLRADVITA